MFSTTHFIWLGISVFFVLIMCFCPKIKKLELKQAGCIMSVIGLCSEISKILSNMEADALGGMHLDPLALPFHLCSLMLFGILFITFGPDGKVKNALVDFLAVMGTLGGICAILIPTNGTDFRQIGSYQCFVYHAGMLWFSIYLIRSGHAKLGRKSLKRNLIMLLSLVFILLYVNGIFSVYHTNFLYLTRPPMENLPYLNLNQGWYIYFLRLLAAGVGVVSLFHLPFILKEKRCREK